MIRRPLLALYAASGLSLAGNAVAAVIVPLYVFAETGSPIITGVAGVCATIPVVIGGALGGVLVDRVGYRRAAILADLSSGLTVLLIPVLAATVGLPLWALLGLVLLGGLLDTPGMTAKSALVPDLAEAAGIPVSRPASTMSAVSRLATLIGASLAALAIVWVGPLAAFAIDAASFALSAILLALFVPREQRRPEPSTGGYWSELASGIRFVLFTPVIRAIVVLVVVTNLIDSAGITVLKPLYASGASEDGSLLGVMVALFAAGAVIGSAWFGALDRRMPRRAMLVTCFLLAGPPPYLAMGLQLPVPVVLVVIAIGGLSAGAINPLLSTVLYEKVPRELRARVLGALSTGVSLGMPLGSLVAGLAVAGVGLAPVLLGAGTIYSVAAASPLLGRSWSQLSSPDGRSIHPA